MDNRNVPNDASAKRKADDERWESDSETVERSDETAGDEGSGIPNRPIGEEVDNHSSLPERGESPDGAQAGRGQNSEENKR